MEIWKDIPNYPGYQASNTGHIRTHNKVSSSRRCEERHWKDRVLKEKVDKYANHRVELWNKDGHKTWLVHRLVAIAFLGFPQEDENTVNHKDGNRHNNDISNLEWLSRAENIRHAFENNLTPTQKPVVLRNTETGEITNYRSRAECGRRLGKSHSYVSNAIIKGYAIRDAEGVKFEVI